MNHFAQPLDVDAYFREYGREIPPRDEPQPEPASYKARPGTAKPADGKAEAEATAKPFALLWAADEKPVLESRWLVKDYLMASTAAVAYGQSYSGKTFLVMDMCLHLAAGLPWHGHRVEKGAVIYVGLEGQALAGNRVVAWKREHGLEGEHIPFARITSAVNLMDTSKTSDAERLVATVTEAEKQSPVPVALIVVDTLAAAMPGGDENGGKDMSLVLKTVADIKERTKAAVLLVHHCGKDEARGMRGWSGLKGAIDTEIEVKADHETNERTATVLKQRDGEMGKTFAFGLRRVELGRDQYDDPVTSCVVEAKDTLAKVEAKGRGKAPTTLTPTEAGWLKDILDLFAQPGGAVEMTIPGPTGTGSTLVRAADRKKVREWLVAKERLTLGDDGTLPDTERTALSDWLRILADKGKLCRNRDYVWLKDRPR